MFKVTIKIEAPIFDQVKDTLKEIITTIERVGETNHDHGCSSSDCDGLTYDYKMINTQFEEINWKEVL